MKPYSDSLNHRRQQNALFFDDDDCFYGNCLILWPCRQRNGLFIDDDEKQPHCPCPPSPSPRTFPTSLPLSHHLPPRHCEADPAVAICPTVNLYHDVTYVVKVVPTTVMSSDRRKSRHLFATLSCRATDGSRDICLHVCDRDFSTHFVRSK